MAEALEPEGGSEPEGGVGAISPSAAMAIGMRKSRSGPHPDPKFDAFLDDQRRLINLQAEHLHEQRALILSRLRWGRFSDRLKALLQALSVVVGLAVTAVVGAIAWSAARDHAVVIDGFSVPPDLAQQGSTGAAMATELHDKLTALREQTVTPATGLDVREKAVSEARVEIPETGVSLAEANRFLHDWLGHERHVSGEVAHVAAGPDKGALAMNVRVEGEAGVRLVQPDGDLEALLQKSAEHVYAAVDPWSFTAWLTQHGRTPEALAFARAMTLRGDPTDRSFGYFAQSWFTQGALPLDQSRELLAKSVALDPHFGLNNLAVADGALGHTELALKGFREAAELAKRPTPGITAEAISQGRFLVRGNVARTLGDGRTALEYFCALYQVTPCAEPSVTGAVTSARPMSTTDDIIDTRRFELAMGLTELHDTADAGRILALPRPGASSLADEARALYESESVAAAGGLDASREQWSRVQKDLSDFDSVAAKYPGFRYAQLAASRALAMAKLGDRAGAEAAAAQVPRDCYPCLIALGRATETLGDRAQADRWFGEAVRQGPSLPQAEEAWGRVMLARGDADGALKQAQMAHRKSPRFGDALELWGESLLKKGDYAGAASRFAEAAKLTPYWGHLHLEWGEALMLVGRYADARRQYETASGLDLSKPDMAALNVLLARTANGALHG